MCWSGVSLETGKLTLRCIILTSTARRRNKSQLGPLKNDEGELIIDPKEQAETMSELFSSVFTHSDGDPPTKTAVHGNRSLNDIEVTEKRVRSLIDGMKENAAPGLTVSLC